MRATVLVCVWKMPCIVGLCVCVTVILSEVCVCGIMCYRVCILQCCVIVICVSPQIVTVVVFVRVMLCIHESVGMSMRLCVCAML